MQDGMHDADVAVSEAQGQSTVDRIDFHASRSVGLVRYMYNVSTATFFQLIDPMSVHSSACARLMH